MVFVGVWTTLDNPQEVSVNLLGFALPSLSLGVWLILIFVVGTLVGMAASLPMIIRSDSENRRLRRNQ